MCGSIAGVRFVCRNNPRFLDIFGGSYKSCPQLSGAFFLKFPRLIVANKKPPMRIGGERLRSFLINLVLQNTRHFRGFRLAVFYKKVRPLRILF
jgi:hypothetical protein